jgi:hypothetical protein
VRSPEFKPQAHQKRKRRKETRREERKRKRKERPSIKKPLGVWLKW